MLIDEFKRRIETVPASERGEVIKKMTENIVALNKDVNEVLNNFRNNKSVSPGENIDNVSDFI